MILIVIIKQIVESIMLIYFRATAGDYFKAVYDHTRNVLHQPSPSTNGVQPFTFHMDSQ